jgi:hypothetical protein
MVRYTEISIVFLVTAFGFSFLGSFFMLPFASYLSGVLIVLSLSFFKKITPFVFLSIFSLSFLLFAFSPLSYALAATFPLIGLFFSGENKFRLKINIVSRYALLGTVCLIYAIYHVFKPESGGASHNLLSVIVAYAIIAEVLYFGKPSLLYIPLIIVSFIVFGNRSSIFLLAAFIQSKLLLLLFLITGGIFIVMTLGLLPPPAVLGFLFKDGGLLFRSFNELRMGYAYEFISQFNMLSLHTGDWRFQDVFQMQSGFYDFHNSFLTIIVRDGYQGLFKVFLWIIQIFFLPSGLFTGITLRASFDTFLLGGINDILVYALIGRSIHNIFRRFRVNSIYHPRTRVCIPGSLPT